MIVKQNPHPALSLAEGEARDGRNCGFALNTESTNSKTTVLLAAIC